MRQKNWELKAEHLPPQRALILAEIAFADFANDRGGMVERAAHRIADAMAKYEDLDRREAAMQELAKQAQDLNMGY